MPFYTQVKADPQCYLYSRRKWLREVSPSSPTVTFNFCSPTLHTSLGDAQLLSTLHVTKGASIPSMYEEVLDSTDNCGVRQSEILARLGK